MRIFLTSTFVAALAISFGARVHAASNDDFECHVHIGHDLDVIETAPTTEVGGEQGYKVVSQIPDGSVFPCFRSDPSREGYMRITPSHGHERWVRLTAVNEGSKDSGGDFDAVPKGTFEKTVAPKLIVPPTDDKPYTLKKRQIYLDSVNQRIQIFDAAGKSWKNPTDEDKRLFVDVVDGVAHDHITHEPVAFVVEDTNLVPNFQDPVTGDIGPRLFYHVAEVPLSKVDDYLKGKHVDGVNYGWVNSDHVRDDQLKPTDSPADCHCTTGEPPKSVNHQLEVPNSAFETITKAYEDRIACPAKKAEIIKASPQRGDGKKISDGSSKNMLHRFLDKLSGVFHSTGSVADGKAKDVLARTMFGEEGNCDSRYAMAVARIAYNRAVAVQKSKHTLINEDLAGEDFKSKQNGLAHSMIEVLSEPAQFQAWDSDKGSSGNLMCIPKDKLSRGVFHSDYNIANEVFENTAQFLADTDSLKGITNFAKDAVKPAAGCRAVKRPLTVRGLRIDNSRCFVAYDCGY